MDETNLPAHARQMSKSQLVARIPELRAAVMAGGEMTRLQRAHTIQLMLLWETYLDQELEGLDKVRSRIERADLQSEAFREALLWDLASYPGAAAEDRRKIKDRVFKALAGAPPTDPKASDLDELKAKISGAEINRPSRFG
jgi:hypothetical protein